MTLVLEIEYLVGTSFAAIGPDDRRPEWPPQPDRIFSALVATWAARGLNAAEAEALEWLEQVAPPRIVATDAEPRTSATVFVPPNDPRTDRQKNARGVLPPLRSRQPRRFPAACPHDPVVRLSWAEANPTEPVFDALKRLAHDTSYVGHSASLTRCRFVLEDNPPAESESSEPARRIYAGRFAELRSDYDAGRRPLPGLRMEPRRVATPARVNVFSDRWLLLRHIDGTMPDVRACALVARTIRDTLLSGYRQIGLGDRIPEEISGHAEDGSATQRPHLAVVPLTFVGFPHADGHVMGFALIPPGDGAILNDRDFRKAVRKLAPFGGDDRRVLTVRMNEGTRDGAFSINLAPTFEPEAHSLDPHYYIRPARAFATVTPIVLDRHLKQSGEARQREIEAQIATACRNIGLPEPRAVVADKHSAFEGAASARPSGKAPAWLQWRVPPSLATRYLTHAIIHFAAPVHGPLIVGAGRYVGLGLCRPLGTGGR